MKICLIYSALYLTLAVCQRPKIHFEPYIIGGKDASQGQFPWQVSLRRRLDEFHFCGGSIISDRFSNFFAVTGTIYKTKEYGFRYDMDTIMVHEDYEHVTADIALLRTAKKITFSNKIQPIELPTRDVSRKIPAVISGWGRTEYEPVERSEILQYANLFALTNEECQKHRPYSNLTRKVCAYIDPTISACIGDSGGPLVDIEDGTLIGICAYVDYKCIGTSVYTRVYSYLDWISKGIRRMS